MPATKRLIDFRLKLPRDRVDKWLMTNWDKIPEDRKHYFRMVWKIGG